MLQRQSPLPTLLAPSLHSHAYPAREPTHRSNLSELEQTL